MTLKAYRIAHVALPIPKQNIDPHKLSLVTSGYQKDIGVVFYSKKNHAHVSKFPRASVRQYSPARVALTFKPITTTPSTSLRRA